MLWKDTQTTWVTMTHFTSYTRKDLAGIGGSISGFRFFLFFPTTAPPPPQIFLRDIFGKGMVESPEGGDD